MGSNPSTSVKSITWEQQKIKKPLEKSIVPYVDSERLSHKHHQKQTPTTQNDTVTQYVTLRHDLAWPLPPDPVYELFTINDSPDSHDYQLLPISPRVRIFEVVFFFFKTVDFCLLCGENRDFDKTFALFLGINSNGCLYRSCSCQKQEN